MIALIDLSDLLPALFFAAQDRIDDGHYVGQALSRTGASGQDIVFSGSGCPDGLHLMPVKAHWLALVICFRLSGPEDPGAGLVQSAIIHKAVYPAAPFKGRVELEQGLGPEQAFFHLLLDLLPDPIVRYVKKTADIAGIVADDAVTQAKNIHPVLPKTSVWRIWSLV